MLKVLLIVVQGKPEGKTIPIVGPIFRVGRGEDCHLRPNSEEVSRRHAEFRVDDDTVTVSDLGSRNGTRVNGKLISGVHPLKSGELVQIGPLTFAVAIQGATSGLSQDSTPPPVATGRPAAASLDNVPNDQIDAWLVSDHSRPTPDRPSGVYDGETLTIQAYREGKGSSSSAAVPKLPEASKSSGTIPKAAEPPKSSGAIPTKPPEPVKPAAVAKPTPPPPSEAELISPFEAALEGIEQLDDGVGDDDGNDDDGDVDGLDPDAETIAASDAADELIDENNPFYAAKKAAATATPEGKPAKPSFESSSDAASDILRRMLDRRRGG